MKKLDDIEVLVSDFETMADFVDLGFYDPISKEWFEFEISKERNDLYPFVKFYKENKYEYIVYYNGIAFDAQVADFIVKNSNDWGELSGHEVAVKVYEFVQKMLDDVRYGGFPPYREKHFTKKVIDVYTILGLDNEARRSSLIWRTINLFN